MQVTAGTTDTPGAVAIFKVMSVSSGIVTGISLISGGTYTATPSNPAATGRLTGSTAGGCTLTISWAPGLLLAPDLSTALDATSTFAIFNAEVQLGDGASGTIQTGWCLPTVGSELTAVQIPTSSQTDSNITVTVNKSLTGNPNFITSTLTNVPSQYKWTGSSSALNAGTSDNAASTDYFGISRPQGSAVDIGFYEQAGALVSAYGSGTARPHARPPITGPLFSSIYG